VIRKLVNSATTVFVAVVMVFLFGLWSYNSLPRESSPDITVPMVLVTTTYVGVAPGDIESLVTIPLENELTSLKDVKEMTSNSAEGFSLVSIEFEPDVNIDEALQKVRDRVNRAQSKLPTDVDDPTVREVSFSDIPVLLVTIAGADEVVLKNLAEDLEEKVTRVPGVLDANITGGREREIHVEVIPERLSSYGLSMRDIIGAIADENVNIPGGTVTSGRSNFLLRVPGEFKDPSEIEGVAVKRKGDRPVFVRDLARVTDGFKDRETYSRMNGRPSVTLSVTKRSGSNILEVAEAIKQTAATESENWPEGVTFRVLGDQSENIESMVSELQNNIITSLLLVVAVLVLFMGARNATFVALAIPLSMLLSFLVLEVLGFTLNMVVLFSLILALGMLVDNAIVVVENIYRHMELGKTPKHAAIDGTNEVAIAVAASTATTVAAFFPMVFWTGIMGEFMGYLPKTVILVLLASLVVAVTALPVITSRLLRNEGPSHIEDDVTAVDPSKLGKTMSGYYRVLDWAISHRYASLGAGIGALVFTFVAYGFLNHGVEFFPATPPDRATVAVRAPEGTDVEETDRIVREVETRLTKFENIDVFVAETGISGSGNPLAGAAASPNSARLTVDFLPSEDRAEPGETIRVEDTTLTITKIREELKDIPGVTITVEKEEMGPPVGAPISVEVSGDDFHEVGEYAQAIMRDIAAIDGVTDLENNYRVGRPELRLNIDRGAAKRVGVSSASIGDTVRTAVAGTKASTLREGEDEFDIVVGLAPEYRSDIQRVLDLRVPGREDTSPDTFPVPISAVASYEILGGTGTIEHKDQNLVVTISGDVSDPSRTNEIQVAVGKWIEQQSPPTGIALRLGGAQDDQQESAAFLARAMVIALVLILMVLVTQFDSLAIPGIIVGTVLLSLVGVLWGLILTGTPFGIMMTGIGVISLAGIVVNNAIVLLDYVQQLEKAGLPTRDALLRAGVTRFRPVMLTATTTTLGLIPMALGISVDFAKFKLIVGSSTAQWWGPMAVAVIFGLTFATLLTLVMVPTLYSIYRSLSLRMFPSMRKAAPAMAALLLAWPAQGQELTIDMAYEAAMENNFGYKLTDESELQAATAVGKATSAFLPQVNANLEYTRNQYEVVFDLSDSLPPGLNIDLGEPTEIQLFNQWQGTASIWQPIFFLEAFPQLAASKRFKEIGEFQANWNRMQIKGSVAQAFYGVAAANASLRVVERALEAAKEQLTLAERRMDAGMATRQAVLQAQVVVSRSQRDVLRTKENVVVARETFRVVTGIRITDQSLVVPPMVDVPESVDDALSVMKESRPDVMAAETQIRAAKATKFQTDAGWAPNLGASFTGIYMTPSSFVGEDIQWRFNVALNWNLFDGGLRIAQSRENASQVRSAEVSYDEIQANAEKEVRVAWAVLKRAEESVQAVQNELDLAIESLRLAEASFGAGTLTWLELEDARVTAERSALARIQEVQTRDLAAIQLLIFMGVFE